MKLNKWPEEVEVDGWRWERRKGSDPYIHPIRKPLAETTYFVAVEKLHVPPTMKEIMEHLLKGGWVRCADYSNADYYYWMNADGEMYYCFKKHGLLPEISKKHESGLSRFDRTLGDWYLVNPFEWYK